MWTKEQALEELSSLIELVTALEQGRRYSAEHTRWIARCLALLEEVFGRNSRYFMTLASLPWRRTGQFLVGGLGDPEGMNPHVALERHHHKAYLDQLDAARGLLQAARDHLERADLASVYEGKDTGPESSVIVRLINLAEHRLRKVVRARPNTEKEIQDALEGLLVGADIPYSRETDRIEYSSKTYTPDFTFAKIDLALEMKLCNRDGKEKDIIAEINDDILAYGSRYGNLVFVVYDLGFIRDVQRFANSFESHPNVVVRVVKH